MIPRILKNWQAFIDGVGYAGLVDEAELPEIEIKTEGHRAGGMDAEFEMDMGMESMTAKLTFAEPLPEVLNALMSGLRIELRGSFVRDIDNSRVAVVAQIGGRPKKISPGSWKAGDKAPVEQEIAVDYYRLTVGGVEAWEVDVINMIRVLGGVDQLAGIRADIGM